MTIALGILAGNSQVIAADTQISSDMDKLSQGKIHLRADMPGHPVEGGVIVITGAGDAAYLQAIQNDLAALFSQAITDSMDELETAMARLIKSFYKDHISITPDMAQRPELELIIAARRGTSSGMWVTKRNKIFKAHSPVAIGIGGAYAQSVLSNLALPQHPETAMLVAAYTVFLVKRRNLWVGMETQVVCLDDSTILLPKGLSASDCRRLEELFRKCIGVESRVLHRIFGSGYKFCESDRVCGDIEYLRKQFSELIHPSSKEQTAKAPRRRQRREHTSS